MNPLFYIIGEIAKLAGFTIPLFPKVIAITIAGTIPFLFFAKTRNWNVIIYILFIVAGWVYGRMIAGGYYLTFSEMDIANSRILAFGILFLYLVIFAITPIAILIFIKKSKWKHLLWLIPLLSVYIGMKINWFL
ncbi:MAG: hypothetical protein PHU64_06995 [Candidatus Omnitrophica bacterium]|nr:hypothetical protein [Candidatus Omnitrophota bacterium]MDD5430215.1 hypothetical protein [Candidatus Omnitrophota bacterium]